MKMVTKLAKLHEVADADAILVTDLQALDVLKYAEVRINNCKGPQKGKGKGDQRKKKSFCSTIPWVSIYN